MKELYFITSANTLVSQHDIAKVADIMGKTLRYWDTEELIKYALSCPGIVDVLVDPSVQQLVNYGCKYEAIALYMRMQNCTFNDAKYTVESMLLKAMRVA